MVSVGLAVDEEDYRDKREVEIEHNTTQFTTSNAAYTAQNGKRNSGGYGEA